MALLELFMLVAAFGLFFLMIVKPTQNVTPINNKHPPSKPLPPQKRKKPPPNITNSAINPAALAIPGLPNPPSSLKKPPPPTTSNKHQPDNKPSTNPPSSSSTSSTSTSAFPSPKTLFSNDTTPLTTQPSSSSSSSSSTKKNPPLPKPSHSSSSRKRRSHYALPANINNNNNTNVLIASKQKNTYPHASAPLPTLSVPVPASSSSAPTAQAPLQVPVQVPAARKSTHMSSGSHQINNSNNNYNYPPRPMSTSYYYPSYRVPVPSQPYQQFQQYPQPTYLPLQQQQQHITPLPPRNHHLSLPPDFKLARDLSSLPSDDSDNDSDQDDLSISGDPSTSQLPPSTLTTNTAIYDPTGRRLSGQFVQRNYYNNPPPQIHSSSSPPNPNPAPQNTTPTKPESVQQYLSRHARDAAQVASPLDTLLAQHSKHMRSSSSTTPPIPASNDFPTLAAHGLYVHDVEGDGNCLFRALSDQYYGDGGKQHATVRATAVSYMATHPDEFAFFVVDESLDQRLRRMAQLGVFGDQAEIVAFARATNRSITIHQRDTPPLLVRATDDRDESRESMHIAYHAWEHYSSVRRIGGPYTGPPEIRVRFKLDAGSDDNQVLATQRAQRKKNRIDNSVRMIIDSLPYVASEATVRKRLAEHNNDADATLETMLCQDPEEDEEDDENIHTIEADGLTALHDKPLPPLPEDPSQPPPRTSSLGGSSSGRSSGGGQPKKLTAREKKERQKAARKERRKQEQSGVGIINGGRAPDDASIRVIAL